MASPRLALPKQIHNGNSFLQFLHTVPCHARLHLSICDEDQARELCKCNWVIVIFRFMSGYLLLGRPAGCNATTQEVTITQSTCASAFFDRDRGSLHKYDNNERDVASRGVFQAAN